MKTRLGTGLLVISMVALSTLASAGTGVRQDAGGRFAAHEVKVFFTRKSSMDANCSRVKAFTRRTRGADVLQDALSELVNGPTRTERRSGVTSFFSRKTAGMVNSVSVSSGVARIDLDDMRRVIPNASTSCGSASLLSELDATAKQFASVQRAVYSFEGSRNAFYSWLQLSPPR